MSNYTTNTLLNKLVEYSDKQLEAVNALNTESTSVTSTNNSSTTLLTASSTFTGTADLNELSDAMVWVVTDQEGILYLEFSQDGTNWDTSLTRIYDPTLINPPTIISKGPRYFRVRFTNTSSSDQTFLRLVTYYGKFSPLNLPINGAVAQTYDATIVRPTDYRSEVAMSKRQGRTTWNKWGVNDGVDTGSPEIIASWGGTFVPRTTASTLSIASTSVNDITSTGTGLNAVVITGVDEDRLQQIEVVQLNGTTPVVTTSTWLGINRIAPFLCGSSKTNEGTITATAVSGGDIMAQVPLGETATQQAIFHIQTGHTFLASWLYINVLKLTGGGGSPKVTIRGYVYSPVANANIQIFKTKIDTDVENTVELNIKELFPVTEKSVLYFTAETDINNTSVDLRFSGVEEKIV